MKIQLFILFLFSTRMISAQEPVSLTLQEAVDYALENSIDLRLAAIELADADEQILERRAIGLPQVSAGVDYQYFLQIPASVVDLSNFDPTLPEGTFEKLQFGLKNNLTASITASSLIFDASYLTALKAARTYRNYATKDRDRVEYEVKSKVIEAYLPALILEESKKTLQKNIDNLSVLLRETSLIYEEGFAEQLDVDRLELSLSNLRTEVENIDRQMEVVYNVLKFQMGYPIDKKITAVDNIEALFEPADDEKLAGAIDFQMRPEVKVLDLAIQLNELNIQANKDGYLPSLSTFITYQQSAQGNNLFDNPIWVPSAIVGLQLNVPIFDGFDKRSKINRAKLDLEATQKQKEQLERSISLEVQNARSNYISALERAQSQKRNVDLAQRIYDTTQIKYKEGVGSSVEVTQAEQGLYETQQNYTQARYDLLVAKMALDKALGDL